MSSEYKNCKVKIDNIYKSFGTKKILQGVSLDIEEGESLVIIGGSGTGKSVTFKCMIGLLTQDSGNVFVEGKDVSKMKGKQLNELRKKFGMLFQWGALFDSLSVWENVGFGIKQHTKKKDDEIKEIAIEKLKMVGLQNIENVMPSELSGGMRKRVSLARAIAMNPEIMLYDEPTTGLDPIMADVINDLIIHLNEKFNMTSITITHDMVSAYKIASRIAMLYKGEIIESGTPDEIKKSESGIIQQFINGRAEGPIKFS